MDKQKRNKLIDIILLALTIFVGTMIVTLGVLVARIFT